MLRYSKIVGKLKKEDEYAIAKLAIYHEIFSPNYTGIASNKKINIIVDYLHNIYLSNGDMDYLYPRVAGAALEVCNYNVQKLFTSIQENGDKLEEEILEALY